ncbi:MAG: hypothetical protein V2I36_05395 [Desulfopila sp.]|jgi:hypothetical protein|nr:hypothetical protein [Desulfopila sp.]
METSHGQQVLQGGQPFSAVIIIHSKQGAAMHLKYSLYKTLLLLGVLALLWGCAAPTGKIGKTVGQDHILPPPMVAQQSDVPLEWQTNDMKVVYEIVKNGGSFTVSGTLHIKTNIYRSFPLVERLDFYIHFLDENGVVLSTHEISPNLGYLRKYSDTLPLVNIPPAPQGSTSFAFSYWGIFRGSGIKNENSGDWEVYFNPFVENGAL